MVAGSSRGFKALAVDLPHGGVGKISINLS
jgi:hypothetical protein